MAAEVAVYAFGVGPFVDSFSKGIRMLNICSPQPFLPAAQRHGYKEGGMVGSRGHLGPGP